MWKAKDNRIVEKLYSLGIPSYRDFYGINMPSIPACTVLILPSLPHEIDPIRKSVLTKEQREFLKECYANVVSNEFIHSVDFSKYKKYFGELLNL